MSVVEPTVDPPVDRARKRRRRSSRDGQPNYGREGVTASFMLLPAVLPYIAFAALPIMWLIYHSFTQYNGFTEPSFIGLENYRRVFRDEWWWASVWTTFKFASGQVLMMLPISLGLAYALFRGVRGRAIYKTIYFLPYVLSMAVVGIVFSYILRLRGGALNGILLDAGFIQEPINFLGDSTLALLSLISVGSWANLGIVILLFLAGMSSINKEILESAQVDGCGEFRIFWHIILPLIRPIFKIVTLVLIIGTLQVFDLVKTLTDGGPAGATDVMFTYLFSFFFEPETVPQIGYAAALGTVASIIVGIVSVIYLVAMRTKEDA